ncbi:MAG: hypothetical protein IPL74_00845 [Bacteroidetes bacterium]|nr:hypothetical protein [Bacteroidota bacterium]
MHFNGTMLLVTDLVMVLNTYFVQINILALLQQLGVIDLIYGPAVGTVSHLLLSVLKMQLVVRTTI